MKKNIILRVVTRLLLMLAVIFMIFGSGLISLQAEEYKNQSDVEALYYRHLLHSRRKLGSILTIIWIMMGFIVG